MKTKRALTILVGGVVVALILYRMCLFQVDVGEAVVLTTFKDARVPMRDAAGHVVDRGSLRTEPGIYTRWFPPIQEVHRYSTRHQVLEDQLQQVQTADQQSVVARLYLVWRIKDPLAFHKAFGDTDQARERLLSLIRTLTQVIQKYRFGELVNADAGQVKLAQLEAEALAQLRTELAKQDYGIEAESLGVRRLVLPEGVTEKVFERMRQTRQTLAGAAKNSGEQEANTIRSQATAAQQRIKAFADKRAQAIRTKGDQEAAEYYKEFQKDEPLAIFLRRIETFKKVLANNSTFILDSNQLSVEELLGKPGTARN